MSELYHYGVLGMKWGIRRYQNPDGTLTAAGERRYRTDVEGGSVERGRLLRADRRTKAGAVLRGAVTTHVINKIFRRVKNLTIEQLTRKGADGILPDRYAWVPKAFAAGKVAANAINWSMKIRDIRAMTRADRADREQNYIEQRQNEAN